MKHYCWRHQRTRNVDVQTRKIFLDVTTETMFDKNCIFVHFPHTSAVDIKIYVQVFPYHTFTRSIQENYFLCFISFMNAQYKFLPSYNILIEKNAFETFSLYMKTSSVIGNLKISEKAH